MKNKIRNPAMENMKKQIWKTYDALKYAKLMPTHSAPMQIHVNPMQIHTHPMQIIANPMQINTNIIQIQCKHTQIQCKSDANLCKKAVPNAEYLLSRPDESSKTVTGVIIEPWPEWTTGGDDDGAPTTHPSWHVPGEQHAQVVNISLGYRSLWQAI